jgi:cell division septation protein DedD
MEKKKAKSTQKTSSGKKYLLQMTRKGVFLSICLIFLISAWMFVLGVLVGRGTAPVHFDIEVLQKELIALKESIIRQEQEKARAEIPSQENRQELDFYEALKKPNKDEKVTFKKAEAQPTAPSSGEKKAKTGTTQPKPLVSMKKRTKTESMPSVKGAFFVQVASTKNAAAADELVTKLNRNGYQAYKVKTEIPGKGTWYRVCAGGYDSQAEAIKARDKLTTSGYKGMVKKN